ncbi:MAG: uroporphyrinogen-III synthase [Gammaproteobacteria bacterium]
MNINPNLDSVLIASNTAGPLAGISVLITRPVIPAARTAKRLAVLGATPLVYPTILIKPSIEKEQIETVQTSLLNAYAVIFVSPSAVSVTLAGGVKLPHSVKVFAPGLGTAEELNLHGIGNIVTPLKSFDSEGLLKLPDLQAAHVNGRHILIFRGDSGRELLNDELEYRGAHVEVYATYHRYAPETPPAGLLELLTENKINVISIMSSSAVTNLVSLVSAQVRNQILFSLPVYASHKRIKAAAEAQGFLNVVETEPGDKGLITSLLNLRK